MFEFLKKYWVVILMKKSGCSTDKLLVLGLHLEGDNIKCKVCGQSTEMILDGE